MSNNEFEFKYSAPTNEERKEVENIRSRYIPQKHVETNLDRIRKLDRKVKDTPNLIALILGIGGALIFGLGLTMILEWNLLVAGIIIGVIGCAIAITAYPIQVRLYKKLKHKYSDEILKLSEEILKNDNE